MCLFFGGLLFLRNFLKFVFRWTEDFGTGLRLGYDPLFLCVGGQGDIIVYNNDNGLRRQSCEYKVDLFSL